MRKLNDVQLQRLRRLRRFNAFANRAFVGWFVVVVITIVGFVGFKAEIWLVALPMGYISLVWMPIVFAQFIFWRCPLCMGMLGRSSGIGIPDDCPNCHCHLRDLDKQK